MKARGLCRIAAVIVATVLAGRAVAFGQEQRGSIEGAVRDVSGGVLPGAVVEARSPALVGTASVATDAQGRYAFWTIKPVSYPIPTDGPVGQLLVGEPGRTVHHRVLCWVTTRVQADHVGYGAHKTSCQ
jgi:protocatechuate 3,4-dioxygenase beta subunit